MLQRQHHPSYMTKQPQFVNVEEDISWAALSYSRSKAATVCRIIIRGTEEEASIRSSENDYSFQLLRWPAPLSLQLLQQHSQVIISLC